MTFQLLQALSSTNTVAHCPDSANLSITDNLDLRARIIVERWATGAVQTIVCKRQGGDEWQFRITATGRLELVWWDTGGTPNVETTSVLTPSGSDGETIWVRTRRSGTSVDFWTSTTDTNDHTAVSWSALGTTQTTPSGSIRSTVATHVNIGTIGNGGGEALTGYYYAVAIVDNVTTRADPVFASSAEWTVGEDEGDTASDGVNTWTLGAGGTIIGNNLPHLDIAVGVQMGFGINPYDQAIHWVDITDDVRTVSFDRGRQYELDRMDMGSASLELENLHGNYNPENTTSVYYPNVKVMTPVRVRAVHSGVGYSLWQGFVERWPVSFPDNTNSLVNVECVDLFKRLARQRPVNISFADVVVALGPRAYWRFTDAATTDTGPEGDHTLTLSGAPTTNELGYWTLDESINLNGSTQYATAADGASDLDITGDMSIIAWVHVDDATGRGTIVDRGTAGSNTVAYSFYVDTATNMIGFGQGDGTLYSQVDIPGALSVEAWLMLSVVRNGTQISIYVNGQVAGVGSITVTAGSTATDTVIGAESDVTNLFDGHISEVAIYEKVLTAADISTLYATRRDDYPAERTDERIGRLLDKAGYTPRDLSVGQTTIATNVPDANSILEAIQTVTDTEHGVFFMSGSGVATFHDRHHRSDTSLASLTEADWLTPILGLDDELLANEILVTPADGAVPFQAVDAASQTEFGPSTLSVSIYPADLNEAADHAGYLLGLFAHPQLRLSGLEFEVVATAPIDILLGAELGDRYTITAPLTGDDLNMDVYLERVGHTISIEKRWGISWQLSPAISQTFWILNSATQSQLGTTTILTY